MDYNFIDIVKVTTGLITCIGLTYSAVKLFYKKSVSVPEEKIDIPWVKELINENSETMRTLVNRIDEESIAPENIQKALESVISCNESLINYLDATTIESVSAVDHRLTLIGLTLMLILLVK